MSDSVQVVCPQCNAINRLPVARLEDGPRCGKCHKPLFVSRPIELDETGFERQIHKNGIPVVVDFWASWCGPCQSMAPEYEKAAAMIEPHARFAKLNTERAQSTAQRYHIRSIPALVIFHEGRELARQSGAMPANAIADWVRTRIPSTVS